MNTTFEFIPKKTIMVWRWADAPPELKALSSNGGDEDWVAWIPQDLKDGYFPWMEAGTTFGCCDVSEYNFGNGIVRIGAHS